jgi:hypothetical protein
MANVRTYYDATRPSLSILYMHHDGSIVALDFFSRTCNTRISSREGNATEELQKFTLKDISRH